MFNCHVSELEPFWIFDAVNKITPYCFKYLVKCLHNMEDKCLPDLDGKV